MSSSMLLSCGFRKVSQTPGWRDSFRLAVTTSTSSSVCNGTSSSGKESSDRLSSSSLSSQSGYACVKVSSESSLWVVLDAEASWAGAVEQSSRGVARVILSVGMAPASGAARGCFVGVQASIGVA